MSGDMYLGREKREQNITNWTGSQAILLRFTNIAALWITGLDYFTFEFPASYVITANLCCDDVYLIVLLHKSPSSNSSVLVLFALAWHFLKTGFKAMLHVHA